MFGGVIATRLRGTFNDPVAGRLALFWIPGGIAAVGLLFAVRSVRSPRGLPLVLAVGLALAAAGPHWFSVAAAARR